MKPLIRRMAIVFLGTFGLQTAMAAKPNLPSPQPTSAAPINRIVAVVNDAIITQTELNEAMQAAREQFQQHHLPLPPEKEFRSKILEGLIFQKLQLQLAKQNKMTVSNKQVDGVINNIAKQNHVTLAELKAKLKEQHVDFTKFKEQIRDQILISNLQQQALAGKVQITQTELDRFKQTLSKENEVEQYHVIDYLIALPDNPTEQQKQEALQPAKQVQHGLKTGSSLPANITTPDMEWQPLENIPDAFATQIVNLHDGDITSPLLTGNGYHVLKLAGTQKQANTISDEQAQQLLMQKKSQKALDHWLQQLKSNSYVKTFE